MNIDRKFFIHFNTFNKIVFVGKYWFYFRFYLKKKWNFINLGNLLQLESFLIHYRYTIFLHLSIIPYILRHLVIRMISKKRFKNNEKIKKRRRDDKRGSFRRVGKSVEYIYERTANGELFINY